MESLSVVIDNMLEKSDFDARDVSVVAFLAVNHLPFLYIFIVQVLSCVFQRLKLKTDFFEEVDYMQVNVAL